MSTPETTDALDFAQLLGPYLAKVPPASLPRLLARLERGAADRYRAWAAALPEHAVLLLSCAASEEQIAIKADALYAAIPEDLAAIEEALPGARDAYFAAFDGLEIAQQLALQAAAERQGGVSAPPAPPTSQTARPDVPRGAHRGPVCRTRARRARPTGEGAGL